MNTAPPKPQQLQTGDTDDIIARVQSRLDQSKNLLNNF